jgi:primary-amine oxidase
MDPIRDDSSRRRPRGLAQLEPADARSDGSQQAAGPASLAGDGSTNAGPASLLTAPRARRPHPLEPLSEDEVRATTAVVQAHAGFADGSVFVSVSLREAPKAALGAYELTGRSPARESAVVLYDGSRRQVVEAVVSLADKKVIAWRVVPGARPKASRRDYEAAVKAVKADPRWQAALASRGVTDLTHVEVQPWPPGYNEESDAASGARVAKALTWVGLSETDNTFARPVENVVATIDLDTSTVLSVEDHGHVPLPPQAGNYAPELASDVANFPRVTELRSDIRPIEITQPEGPGFVLDGHEIRWQKWHLVIGYTPREGLVLHRVRYLDGERERSILDRASLSEMWVPYGDPAPVHRVKDVFDAGEAGIGGLANPLRLGCDCLGEISYLDAIVNDDAGEPVRLANAVCIHEEDTGIGWKHTQHLNGTVEVRRGRRLVISTFTTVGNYDYGFFWYLHTDGTIAYEVKLTGIISTGAFTGEARPAHGTVVAPGLYGPHHQHFFNVRLDMAVDGTANSVFEVDAVPVPTGPGNPAGNAWVARELPLESEAGAQRLADISVGRHWLVVNEGVRNAHGRPVGYQLVPGPSTLPPLQPDAPALQRAQFATRHLWVTAYDPDQLHAAGDYPYQHPGGAGLPAYAREDRPVRDADIVVWHTFAAHHVVRPEDWPVMPVTTVGFQLRPFGYFGSNPALDLPRPQAGHCHSGSGEVRDDQEDAHDQQ